MAAAAKNAASTASGPAAPAGHDVIFTFRGWPSVGLVGVQENVLSGSATAHKRKKQKRGGSIALASVCPSTRGRWPLRTALGASPRPMMKGQLSQSSSDLTPNFRVKTSAHYYPNGGSCSSRPLIIQQYFSANLASRPLSLAAPPCPRGRSSIYHLRGPGGATGTDPRAQIHAAPQKQVGRLLSAPVAPKVQAGNGETKHLGGLRVAARWGALALAPPTSGVTCQSGHSPAPTPRTSMLRTTLTQSGPPPLLLSYKRTLKKHFFLIVVKYT